MFDQDNLRALSTLLLFLAFMGVCFNVYRRSRKSMYDEAAQLPFIDESKAKQESRDE